MKADFLTGQKFNRLYVISEDLEWGGKGKRWICKCDCGNTKSLKGYDIKNSIVKSCGCLKKEQDVKNLDATKHNKSKTKLYGIWSGIKSRVNDLEYARYGGRGIKICDEWLNFETFYNWSINNGFDKNLQIDRIDNNGNYDPNNCKWSTSKEQCRNRSTNIIIEYNNSNITLIELSEKTNIPYGRLSARYKRGDRGENLLRPINKTDKKRGSNNSTSKINETIAIDIKKRLLLGEKGSDIARLYKVSKYLISDIKRGKTWNWL